MQTGAKVEKGEQSASADMLAAQAVDHPNASEKP